MFTQEQEEFLAKFANEQIAKRKEEDEALALRMAIRAKTEEREALAATLKAQKDQEIADALKAYDDEIAELKTDKEEAIN
jgi:hypothetical protein